MIDHTQVSILTSQRQIHLWGRRFYSSSCGLNQRYHLSVSNDSEQIFPLYFLVNQMSGIRNLRYLELQIYIVAFAMHHINLTRRTECSRVSVEIRDPRLHLWIVCPFYYSHRPPNVFASQNTTLFSFIDMRMNQCNSALKSKIMIYQMLISCNFKKILHRNITELRIDSSVMSIKHPFSTNDDITNSIWMLRNCKTVIEADNMYLIFIAYFMMPYNVFMYALIGGL